LIIGLGIDLVETKRIAKALARHGDRFERRVFTSAELAECRERADRELALSARFAAKEACMKALGVGLRDRVSFLEIEVTGPRGERPEIRLSGVAAERGRNLGVRGIHVSLTHQPALAAAVVAVES